MKLAEALLLRSKQQNKIENLRERIRKNLKIQEGDNPAEDPTPPFKGALRRHRPAI